MPAASRWLSGGPCSAGRRDGGMLHAKLVMAAPLLILQQQLSCIAALLYQASTLP